MKSVAMKASLALLAAAALVKVSSPWSVYSEIADSIAATLTFPARWLAGIVVPESFWADVPYSIAGALIGYAVWAALTVAYWVCVRWLYLEESWDRARWTFLAISIALSVVFCIGMLSHWGCWRADTPCTSQYMYFAALVGSMLTVAVAVRISLFRRWGAPWWV